MKKSMISAPQLNGVAKNRKSDNSKGINFRLILTNILVIFCMVLVLLATPGISYASQKLTVKTDGGGAVSIFGDLKISNNTSGDVVVILGNADITSDVDGDVVSILGKINLDAGVTGDVVNILGNVTLSGNASVGGDLVSIGTAQKAHGAKVNGQHVEIDSGTLRISRAFITILLAFFTLIIGLFTIAVSRSRLNRISAGMENNIYKKLLLGLIGFFGASIILVLLCITVVVPLLYILLLFFAEITAGIYFGRQILKVFDLKLSIYLEFFAGLLFILIVKLTLTLVVSQYNLITYLVLYSLFSIYIYSLGLGVLFDYRFGAKISSVKKANDRNTQVKVTEMEANNAALGKDLNMGGNPDESK